MKFWRNSVLFYLGGSGYMGLELLWRGRSHGSMFLAGGSAFLLLGQLQKRTLPLPVKMVFGAAAITGVELVSGFLFNADHRVWDYSSLPFSFAGQICLPFSLLWLALSLPAMGLYSQLDRRIPA